MGVLDQVNNLKKEGLRDEEISTKLREQGVSPSSIYDAFNQLKVKGAIESDNSLKVPTLNQNNYYTDNMQEQPPSPGQFYTPRTVDVENSDVQSSDLSSQEDYYVPQEYESTQELYPPTPGQPAQEYYPQYGYDQGEYQPSSGTDTDMMIEIAEQVFAEKTKKMQKQLDMLSEFASLAESKIESNNDRIKRIEKIMDNLQIKILEKVSSYGDNLEGVKKEMSMMQDSFSKVLPRLAEAHAGSHHKSESEKK